MPDITATRPTSGQPIETAWGQAAHDGVEGIQAGKVALVGITNAATIGATITFARPFASVPSIITGSTSVGAIVGWNTQTTTGFQIVAKRWDSATALTIDANWIAVGPMA